MLSLLPERSASFTQSRIAASSEIVRDLNVGDCPMFATLFQSVAKMTLELNWAVRDRELHRRRGLAVATQAVPP